MGGIPSTQITSIQSLRAGDHIKYRKFCFLYAHHAIVCEVKYNTGYYTIIHFAGDGGKTGHVTIRMEEKQFVPDEFHVLVYPNRLPMDQTIAVANFFLNTGFGDYNLIHNNCEHFASICACGKALSVQERKFAETMPLVSLPKKRKIVIIHWTPLRYVIELSYEDT